MRSLHRLLLLANGINPQANLNPPVQARATGPGPDSAELLGSLRDLIAGATRDDGQVDYRSLRDSPGMARYRAQAARLRDFDPATIHGRGPLLAFWINLYNALVIDAVVHFEVDRSVREVPGFFWRAAYDMGGLRFSANDIEHGVLRGNGVHPLLPGRHFSAFDPRRRHVMTPPDPRIHFALVCASRSCPPIRTYSPDRIDDQLTLATTAFLRATSQVDPDGRCVHLSRIFQWYSQDFGGPFLGLGDLSGLRRTIAGLARPGNPELARALEDPGSRLSFEPYDWSLNGLSR